MPLFKWDNSYDTGFELIDEQHRHLVQLINELDASLNEQLTKQVDVDLISGLIDYAKYHFETEEVLMFASGSLDPHFELHRAKHRDFRRKLQRFIDRPSGRLDVKELLAFLFDWLTVHMLKEDQQLARILGGTPGGVLGLGGEKQLLNALLESEARFSALAEHAPVLLWLSDSRGERVFFNAAWRQATAREWCDLQGDGWLAAVHEEDRECYLVWYQEAVRDQCGYEIEYRLVSASGDSRWIHERVQPRLMEDGRYVGLIGSAMDITERKKAEQLQATLNEELRRRVAEKTEALEAEKAAQQQLIRQLQDTQQQLVQSEKMAAIGHLAAGVAHEINNPVGYVKSNTLTLNGYVEKLVRLLDGYHVMELSLENPVVYPELQRLKAEVDPEFLLEDIRDLVTESLEGLERIQQIVSDLKDFSRVESNDWQFADMAQCLDTTLNVARNELKYKVDVEREYQSCPPVECLPNQICQVVMNLLVNAAQAIEKQGTLWIRTYPETGGVVIEVEDNGSGIPDSVREQIFNPFFTTKPVGKGTGLGLSISWGIVQKHGGKLTVASEPGKGSCFRIWLPERQPKEEEGVDLDVESLED